MTRIDAMKIRRLLPCLLAGMLLISGCDVFRLDTESTVLSGRWASNVVARSGDCCHIDLTLNTDDEIITGRGTINTPGQSLGEELQFTVEVSGQFANDRLELRSSSQSNPVFIQGVLDEESDPAGDVVLRVDFEGFGKTGNDIILFQR